MEQEPDLTNADEHNQLLDFNDAAHPESNEAPANDLERRSEGSHNVSQSILDNSVTYAEILNQSTIQTVQCTLRSVQD